MKTDKGGSTGTTRSSRGGMTAKDLSTQLAMQGQSNSTSNLADIIDLYSMEVPTLSLPQLERLLNASLNLTEACLFHRHFRLVGTSPVAPRNGKASVKSPTRRSNRR